ncbi:MAG: PilZ domain-containing protein [Candidatus Omnitrophota bacterium]|jgi:hypothetical protein
MVKEKRDYTRFSIFMAPVCCERADCENVSVSVNDISGSGLGIVTNEKLTKGDKVDLELNIPEDDIPIFVTGEVSWVVRDESVGSTYRAGVRLVKLSRPDKDRLMRYLGSNVQY